MAALTTIAAVITAAAAVGGTVHAATRKGPKAPKIQQAPQLAPSVQPDKTATQLAGLRPQDQGNQPNFLQSAGFSSMTPLQQRAQIATQATQGSSQYRSQEALDYYKNLAQRSLIGEGGGIASYDNVLPVERQFASQVFGQDTRSPTTESFLSAVLRG